MHIYPVNVFPKRMKLIVTQFMPYKQKDSQAGEHAQCQAKDVYS
jgi:hypothetical protein